MLGKLIKHDFKAAARQFIPLFLFVILMTPLTRFSFWFSDFIQERMPEYSKYLEIIPNTVICSYVVTMIIFSMATVLILATHFYRSMVTREGYLTHTLPVTSMQLIGAKTFVSVIWTILAITIGVLSVLALLITMNGLTDFGKTIASSLKEFQIQSISEFILFFIELLMLMIASIAFSYGKIFFCISIGQLCKDHKLLASFGIYFGLNILQRFVTNFGMVFITLFLLDSFVSMKAEHILRYLVMPSLILMYGGMCAIFLAISNQMFKKHLNLQ
ncbi:MAG: hypothetical protein PUB10_02810 [Clostridiales bacterium]|nr:hypothetical protein [Clostridiales bacterium]